MAEFVEQRRDVVVRDRGRKRRRGVREVADHAGHGELRGRDKERIVQRDRRRGETNSECSRSTRACICPHEGRDRGRTGPANHRSAYTPNSTSPR